MYVRYSPLAGGATQLYENYLDLLRLLSHFRIPHLSSLCCQIWSCRGGMSLIVNALARAYVCCETVFRSRPARHFPFVRMEAVQFFPSVIGKGLPKSVNHLLDSGIEIRGG
jgi:hypothetical protein